MKKSLSDFPPDVQDTVYQIIVQAILRAIQNGTFKPPQEAIVRTDS